MSDIATTEPKPRVQKTPAERAAENAERIRNTLGDVEEGLGAAIALLAKRDKSWLTPDMAHELRQYVGSIAPLLGTLSNTLEAHTVMTVGQMSVRADGAAPTQPGGMFREALNAEAAAAPGA